MAVVATLIYSYLLFFGYNRSLGVYANKQQHQQLQKFVVDYFQFMDVSSVSVFACPTGNESYPAFVPFKEFLVSNFYLNIITSSYVPISLHQQHYKVGVLIDLHCSSGERILKNLDSSNQFFVNNIWFLVTRNVESLENSLSAVFITPDSDCKVLVLDEGLLLDVYKVARYKPLKLFSVTRRVAAPENAIRDLKAFKKNQKYRSLNWIYLKSGIVVAFPDVHTSIDDVNMRHIDTIAKANYPLTANLGQDLQFRLDLIQMDNYGWIRNGTFDGFMGQLQQGRLKIGANAIFMRLDRVPVVDFVAETFKIRACIMFRQPPLSAVANIFALPFSGEVWWSILIFLVVTTSAMAMQILHPQNLFQMEFSDCFIFAWGALCQQGFYAKVSTRPIRILLFTTFITTLFLFTSFSANIVALLQSPSEAISSISDLTQSPLEVGVQDTVYNKVYFKETTDSVTRALFTKKIQSKGENVFIRPNIGMEKVRTGLFAFQVEAQTGYQIISDTYNEHEKCGLKELDPFHLPILAIPTSKTFPYKELFRQRLRWQREVGLMKREGLKWFPQKPICENNVAGFVSIGLTECRYAVVFFGIGIIIAAFAFTMEIIFKKLQ